MHQSQSESQCFLCESALSLNHRTKMAPCNRCTRNFLFLSTTILLLLSGSVVVAFSQTGRLPTKSSSSNRWHLRSNKSILAHQKHKSTTTTRPNPRSLQSFDSLVSLRAGSAAAPSAEGSNSPSLFSRLGAFANKNFFLVGMFVAVTLAKFFPQLDVDGGTLLPELFIGKYGVALIFLLSGLSLQTSELTQAASNLRLNGLIQFVVFVVWPFLIGVPMKSFLNNVIPNAIPPALVDGFLIMTCLPTTVNMCIMLTSAGGGNVATSICNAVISNMAGIFITPALLLRFFGTDIKLPFVAMVLKLCKKVLLPVGKLKYDN